MSASAQIKDWVQPSSEELSMTSEPKAPGAPVILLFYQEYGEADTGEVWIHARFKVLTEEGIGAGTLALPESVVFDYDLPKTILARTIHRDGSVVEFHGTQESSLGGKELGVNGHIISMPSVEVGSILELICHFPNVNTESTQLRHHYAPVWQVQRGVFQRMSQFTLVPPSGLDQDSVRWVSSLPKDAEMRRANNTVSLTLHDVPAASAEDFMPASDGLGYHVRFFYNRETRDEFWSRTGEAEDRRWSFYYVPQRAVTTAVAALIAPYDTDEQKLHKLYAAVNALENTDLTRTRTGKEDKRLNPFEAENSDVIWSRKRGNSSELTLLFIAMARAAGYKAYPMAITSRGRPPFDQDVLSWRQLDSLVAIVNVKGKDIFFDPGTRTCEFARMAPWHANVVGVSSEDKFIKFRYTPQSSFGSALSQRVADLKIDADGNVSGVIRLGWTGNAGLPYRLEGFSADQAAVAVFLSQTLQKDLPEGLEIKLETLTGLDKVGIPLVATFSVSGKVGQLTAKRLVLPAELFESRSGAIFVPEKRTLPIAFPAMVQAQDVVTLHLPAGMKVESLPANQSLHLAGDTLYQATASTSGTESEGLTVRLERTFALKRIDYKIDDYSNLRQYFGQVAAADHEQLLLTRKPGETAALAP